jgi:AcrR family transcriptional regulator
VGDHTDVVELGRSSPGGGSQADRRAHTRNALLESAAQDLSRYGYGNLVLERVARKAGYTRGALYHQFRDKQDLTLAVIEWLRDTWIHEVAPVVAQEPEPVAALLALARGHAVFCRRNVARAPIGLRLEFSGQDNPVSRKVEETYQGLVNLCADLIQAGRLEGSLPAGPPVEVLALAFIGVLEGAVIALAGHPPHDEFLAARAVAGVLGLDPGRDAASSDWKPTR